jgi:hypothetical protein
VLSRRIRSRVAPSALTIGAALVAGSCGSGELIRPDALRPEIFELTLIDNQTLPVFAYKTETVGGQVWMLAARIVSVEPGRTVDPRIFDDRSGNGANGGNSRDSTTASARMADIRTFQEREPNGITINGTRVDSTPIIVERRGDLIIFRKDHPDPARVRVDTAQVVDGKLLRKVREWEQFHESPRPVTFQYVITKSLPE